MRRLLGYLPRPLRSRLEQSELLRRILENTGWIAGERVARMLVALLVGAWVARYLGPVAFGQLNFAVAYVTILASLSGLGLDSILVRNLVSHADERDAILGTAFALRLVAGAASYAIVLLTIGMVRPDEAALMVGLAAVIGLGNVLAAFDVIDYWFQSRIESRYVVYARTASFLTSAPLRVVLILVRAPLVAFAWAVLVEALVAAVGLVVVFRRTGRTIRRWVWRSRTAVWLLKDSWPLIFSNIMIMLYMRIDQVMLGRMVGDGELGLYSVAVRLLEVWYFVPTAIVASTFPSIVEAGKRSEELFYHRLQRLYNAVSLLSYGIAVPVTLTAPWIIYLLFGDSYRAATPVLIVLIWSIHFTSLGMARSSFLMSMNWTRLHFATVVFGAASNVVLNLVLIPRYGALGSAWATLISYWLAAHGTCFLYPSLRRTGLMLTRALVWPKP